MKPSRLIHLFQHIVHTTDCPKCKAKINPKEIKVKGSTNDLAFLEIHCLKCHKNTFLQIISTSSNPFLLHEIEKNEQDITEDNVYYAQRFLVNHEGGIDQIFPYY